MFFSKTQKMDDAHHKIDKPLQIFTPHIHLLDKPYGHGIKGKVEHTQFVMKMKK
jgi:hypothetical protein